MTRFVSFFVFLAFSTSLSAQIRLDRLELMPKQEYKIIGSDVLVVDTLVMRDSSKIILNRNVKENIINVKVLVAGKGCVVFGRGINGEIGKIGASGLSQNAPCRNGGDGKEGANGTIGGDALNLSFFIGTLKINGTLTIDLNGGDGGSGGKGGKGGDGGSGTRVCRGGNGGAGGNGGNGSNGGHGGILLISCKLCYDLHQIHGERLIINTYGGYAGNAGDGGQGGQAGLGPTQDGRNGARGVAGIKGIAGKTGAIKFDK